MNITGIYKIQSKVKPERIYIGSTKNISIRWKAHLNSLKSNKHRSIKLQRHYNKYGIDDLIFSIVEQFDFQSKEHLLSREQYYLDNVDCYFNHTKTAGSRLGIKCSESTKLKLKNNKNTKGKHWKISEEASKHLSELRKGKSYHSEERKKNLSILMSGNTYALGCKHTEETKEKVSKSHIGLNTWSKGKPSKTKGRHWKLTGKARENVINGILKRYNKVA